MLRVVRGKVGGKAREDTPNLLKSSLVKGFDLFLVSYEYYSKINIFLFDKFVNNNFLRSTLYFYFYYP